MLSTSCDFNLIEADAFAALDPLAIPPLGAVTETAQALLTSTHPVICIQDVPIAIGTEETLANVGDKVEGEVHLVRSARGRCQLRKGQIVTVTEFETHRLDTGIDHEGIAVMLGGEPSVPHAEGEDFPCIPIRRAGFHVKIGAGIEVPMVTLDAEDGLGWRLDSSVGLSVMRMVPAACAVSLMGTMLVLVPPATLVWFIQVAAHDTEGPSV